MTEKETILIKHTFNISAVHVVNGREEIVADSAKFKDSSKYSVAQEKAVKIAQEKWPTVQGYYGHFAC